MVHDYDEQELPAQHIYHHTAPFFRECRAYGALIKVGLNRRYAARCHGHLAIPNEQTKQLIHFPLQLTHGTCWWSKVQSRGQPS